MLNKIINTCQKFNKCVELARNGNDLTDEEYEFVDYFNIELAKSILQDMGHDNAKQIAKTILSVTG